MLPLSEAARNAAILDTLPLHIALIDSTASITSVNAAWTAFADGNSVQCAGLGVGSNYLQICDAAVGPDVGDARAAGAGIRSVLAGTAQEFILEYPCHSPSVQRWFQMTVSPVISATSIGAVIMHLDISVRRLAAQNLLESELRFRQMAENIREVFVSRDLDGSHVLYVSPAFEEIWGRSRESLDPPELPTIPGGLSGIERNLSNLAKKLGKVPSDAIATDVRHTLQSMRTTLQRTEHLVQRVDEQLLPTALATIAESKHALQSVERLTASDSPLQQDAREAMRQLGRASQSLQTLADYLDRHPEALIRGRKDDNP